MSGGPYLVTGGGGFVGGALIRALREREPEAAIRAYQRSPQPALEALGVRVVQGDLGEVGKLAQACRGVETVFHVAARAGVWGTWEDYYQPNMIGTRNVLYAARNGGTRFLVYTSSPSVVFGREAIAGADESLPYPEEWLFHYGRTKALAEMAVREAHDPAGSGLSTVALRPHLIWGPGDPHLVPRLLARARAGRLAIVGEGRNRVDLTHIRNTVQGHLRALDSLRAGRAGGQAYFLSDGAPVVLWEWINSLLGRLGMKAVRRRVPLGAALAAGGALEWIWGAGRLRGEPPMTRFVATQLGLDHWFDISAARRDLGYTPQVETEADLGELARWAQGLEGQGK